jgi:hypothetical protein
VLERSRLIQSMLTARRNWLRLISCTATPTRRKASKPVGDIELSSVQSEIAKCETIVGKTQNSVAAATK